MHSCLKGRERVKTADHLLALFFRVERIQLRIGPECVTTTQRDIEKSTVSASPLFLWLRHFSIWLAVVRVAGRVDDDGGVGQHLAQRHKVQHRAVPSALQKVHTGRGLTQPTA